MWRCFARIVYGLHCLQSWRGRICQLSQRVPAVDFLIRACALALRLNDKLQELGYPAIGRLTLHPSTLRDEGELKAWVEQRLEPFLEEQVPAHAQERTI